VARIELLDGVMMGAVNAHRGLDYPSSPTLLLEFRGLPISRLGDCIEATKADIEASHLLAPIVGHVGDGNFHLSFVLDVADPIEMASAAAVDERMVERALAMGGTCTGEHGIGLGKVGYLEQERGPGIAVMRRLKEALDPLGIMNPGKVLRQPHPAPASVSLARPGVTRRRQSPS
jgi:FAD/FMN-containing dehydrogenase